MYICRTKPKIPYDMTRRNTTRDVLHALMLTMMLVVLSACESRKAKNFVNEFATAYAAGDYTQMVQMYPDSKSFALAEASAESFEVSVEPVEGQEGTYKATLNEGIELTVKQADGGFVIESSRGLLQLPSDMTFATGTGQYKAELTDLENAQRLADQGFVRWVLNDVVKELDKKVKVVSNDWAITSRRATDWFDPAHKDPICEKYNADIKVTVQNELDSEISADAFSVVSSVYTVAYFTEPAKCAKTTNVQTKTIAAHSSIVLTYPFSGEGDYVEGMGWIDHVQSVLSFNIENLNASALYKPHGGEYEEYLKNPAAANADSMLNIVLHGKLGGDAASTFILNGEEGSYVFSGATRQAKLVSYDPQSGELVVDAYLNGARIGNFNGVYANDCYKGIFTNTNNGAKLNFKLTK